MPKLPAKWEKPDEALVRLNAALSAHFPTVLVADQDGTGLLEVRGKTRTLYAAWTRDDSFMILYPDLQRFASLEAARRYVVRALTAPGDGP